VQSERKIVPMYNTCDRARSRSRVVAIREVTTSGALKREKRGASPQRADAQGDYSWMFGRVGRFSCEQARAEFCDTLALPTKRDVGPLQRVDGHLGSRLACENPDPQSTARADALRVRPHGRLAGTGIPEPLHDCQQARAARAGVRARDRIPA
jgi:hypothetical protein